MFHVKPSRAALVVALLVLSGPGRAQEADLASGEAGEPPLAAGEVRLTSPGLEVRGRVLGFDGRFLRIEAATGELMVDTQAMACEGAACPDPEGFVPQLRLSGDAVLGEALLPTLIEGFAAAQGWELAGTDPYVLRRDGAEVLQLALRLTTTDDGIADLLADEADLALLARAPSPAETERLVEAGLGGAGELRLRPLAQGALVPATGPGQRVGRITLEDLARVYSGEVTSWAELGGEDLPVRAHLGPEGSAGAQAFLAEVLGATGRALSPEVIRHPDEAALRAAVAADAQALGILPFESYGDAQPLALVGQCRLPWVPRPAAVRAGDYPLTVPLALLQPMRRLAPEAQAFVDFLATPEAQLVLRRGGLVGTEAVPVPWAEQGERLAAAIREAGPEVPLRELQRLVRVLGPFTRLSTTFRFGSGTELDPLSRGLVLRLAHEIADGRYAGRTLILAGFSDGRGAAEENRALSMRRTEAVREALLEALGSELPEGLRLRLHAFGEALPIGCDGEGEGPWSAEVNRRVELWVSG
jgi:phosphate transport system substrate-binding protein